MNIAVALLSVLITVGIIACFICLNRLCRKYLGAELIEVFVIIIVVFIIVAGFIGVTYTIYKALMGQLNLT